MQTRSIFLSFPISIHTCEFFPFFPLSTKGYFSSVYSLVNQLNSPSVQTQNLKLFQVHLAVDSVFVVFFFFVLLVNLSYRKVHTHKFLDRLPYDKATLVKKSNIASTQKPFVDAPLLWTPTYQKVTSISVLCCLFLGFFLISSFINYICIYWV